MTKPKVLLVGAVEHAHTAWNKLSEIAEIITPKAQNRSEFIEESKSGAFDGVVAIYRTFASFRITGRFDEEIADALPKSVRGVAHVGAGYDQVSIEPFTKRGIWVSNVPTAVDDATADTALFLLIGALRNFNKSILTLREGTWRGKPALDYGHDPQGKVLGILGLGGIGRNFARKAKALGMSIAYHNRKRLPAEQEDGAKYLSFEELLRTADVLSLHVPLNQHTRHMLSTKEFEMMKDGAVVINTARGAVIDEAALVKALEQGKIASVGLDVYEDEPEIHPGLVKNPYALLLPHVGTWTHETLTKMEEWAMENVERGVRGEKPKSIVPEQRGILD